MGHTQCEELKIVNGSWQQESKCGPELAHLVETLPHMLGALTTMSTSQQPGGQWSVKDR
jgi:hypothetical protein